MIPAPDADARLIALAQAYRAADYRWRDCAAWVPLAIGEPAAALEARFPRARTFGLVSAWNPQSQPRARDANRLADAALRGTLEATGLVFVRAVGAARDRGWREPGWLVVDLPLAEFDALARRFGQLGSLHADRGARVRLRLYAPPPRTGADLDHVDWVE